MTEKKQKYERKKEVENKTRNNNFAAALDYLKRQSGQRLYQKDLAEMLGVTENTISNIIKYRTAVSEDMITQLQTVSGGVFNLQWLRGQSDVMLAKDVQPGVPPTAPAVTDWASVALAAKDETIEGLKRELDGKDKIIATKDAQLADRDRIIAAKDAHIDTLQQQLSALRAQLAIEKGLLADGISLSELVEKQVQDRQSL